MVDETILVGRVNTAIAHSAFIYEEEAYTVELLEDSIKVQSYDLKTGKEEGPVARYNTHMDNCLKTESTFVCLSLNNREIHYTTLPLETSSKWNTVPLSSLAVLESSTVEDLSTVDNVDAVKLTYNQEKTSNILLLSFKDGEISGSKTLAR